MRCLVELLVNDYGGKFYDSSGRRHLSNYSRYFCGFLSHFLTVAHVSFRFGACLVAFSNEIGILRLGSIFPRFTGAIAR